LNPLREKTGPLLYAIVDRSLVAPERVVEVGRGLIEMGADILQYRDKTGDREGTASALRLLVEAACGTGVPVLANDDPELALEAGAAGVHLGQEDPSPRSARRLLGSDALLGLSTHGLREVRAAQSEPVDYVAFGPVFASPTKTIRPARGLEILGEAVRLSRHPVFGIGGIDPGNARSVVEAGARGVAAISALFAEGSLSGCRDLVRALRGEA
jgi:thiamine-phosphate pyrophosphorylase